MDRKERLGGASCCEGGRVLKIGKERRERAGKSRKEWKNDGKDGAKRKQASQWYERQLAWAGAY